MSNERHSQNVVHGGKSAEQWFKIFWAIEVGVISFLQLCAIVTFSMMGLVMQDTPSSSPGSVFLGSVIDSLITSWPMTFAFIAIEALTWVAGVYLLRRGKPIQLGIGLLVLAPILSMMFSLIWSAR